MRTQFEINRALSILNSLAQEQPSAKVQVEVISKRMDERTVFEKYVLGVAEGLRDEALFFAARDAARYLKGDIDLDILIPGVYIGRTEVSELVESEGGNITLSRKDFNQLLQRIERLEQWVGFRRKPTTVKPSPLPEGINLAEMMIQSEACAYLQCSKISIKKMVAQKILHSYQDGRNVYYSRKELMKVKSKRDKVKEE